MTDKSIERSGNNNKDHKQELSNVPELRFPGFKGEWISFKLSEVADVRDGTHDSPKYIEKGFPLITSKNLLQNGNINFDNVNYISEKDYMKINKRSEVSNGDILFGMIGTIGNPVLVKSNKKFAIKNVALIKEEKNLKNSYLIHYLNSNKISKQFYKYIPAAGSGGENFMMDLQFEHHHAKGGQGAFALHGFAGEEVPEGLLHLDDDGLL